MSLQRVGIKTTLQIPECYGELILQLCECRHLKYIQARQLTKQYQQKQSLVWIFLSVIALQELQANKIMQKLLMQGLQPNAS